MTANPRARIVSIRRVALLGVAALTPALASAQQHAPQTPAGREPLQRATPGSDRTPVDAVLVFDNVSRIIDPKLSGGALDVTFHVEPAGASAAAMLEVWQGTTLIDTVWTGKLNGGAAPTQVAWDGRDTGGAWCDTGTYTLRGSLSGLAFDQPFDIVRLGVTELEAQDSPAGNDEWQMVYFMKGTTYAYYATPAIHEYLNVADTGEVSDLDLDNGDPRPVEGVHTETDTPPLEGQSYEDDCYNFPLSYIRGASPRIELTFGDSATSSSGSAMGVGYPMAGFELRSAVSQDGGAKIYTTPITAGGTAVVDLAPLPNEVMRVDTNLEISWQYRPTGGGTWSDVPGETTIPLRIYTLLDEPNFANGAVGTEYTGPWVEVADYISSWKETLGITTDSVAALTEVHVQGFVGQNNGIPTAIEGVLYDSFPLGGDGGATRYFQQQPWRMDLSSLLNSHARGVYVNCTDNMGATSTMLAMMGVDNMRGLYLGPMNLKAIWGIGAPGYTTNLWGNGHAFSFHQIVTDDDLVTVSDTCMQLDEDGNPNVTPGTPGWNHHRNWDAGDGYDFLSSYNAVSGLTIQPLPRLR